MAPFKKSTTQLPTALREELGLPEPKTKTHHPYNQSSRPARGGGSGRGGGRGEFNNSRGSSHSKSNSVVGRKESRKLARKEKKTKPTLKVIGRGISAEQHERQKREGGTAKSFERKNGNGNGNGNGKQREVDLDEEENDGQSSGFKSDRKEKEKVEINKKKKDPSSTSSQSSQPLNPSNPTLKKRPRDDSETKEGSNYNNQQRKYVDSKIQTPLERMLSKAENKSSSKKKGKQKELDVKKKPRSRMTQMEKDEEDEIRWLEAKLLKEKKGDDLEDDLDGFIEDLNRFQPGMYSDEDEDEDELDDQDSEEDSGLEDAEPLEEEGSEDEDKSMDWEAAVEGSDAGSEEVDISEGEEDEDEESDDDEEEEESEDPTLHSKETPSNPNETKPSMNGKYIPPAARAAAAAAEAAQSSSSTITNPSSATESVEIQKLRRKAQGQLNRLGENNIESILLTLTDLYDNNSRAKVSEILTSLILETISNRADLGNRFVILYATLIGGLHRIVGIEFGASVVQKVVENLIQQYEIVREFQKKEILKKKNDQSKKDGEEEEKEGKIESDQIVEVSISENSTFSSSSKECINLLILLSELYNLEIIACPLIYDLIKLFLRNGIQEDNLKEEERVGMVDIDIELLLKVVKTCGKQLRHDDPTSLKSIISVTQENVSSSSSSSTNSNPKLNDHLGSRPKFMLETLNDLKNNRQRKGTSFGGGDSNGIGSEELNQKMKKFLNGLNKKHSVRNFESLRIGLKDLQEAGTKGKWWLVGSAWTGHSNNNENDEDQNEINDSKTGMTISRPLISEVESKDETTSNLLKEARKHGMNTDSKRRIFLSIMSSEDYIDASNKLLQLKLNEFQRREIIKVLLVCLGQENQYNPFYTLIGVQLSKDFNDRDVKITLQYSLWDFFRELGEKKVGGISKIGGNVDDEDDKSSDDDDDDDDDDEDKNPIKGPELQKIVNVARAYGWWVAKDCLSLSAFKTINFTSLKSKGKLFLQIFFIHFLLSIQSNSPSSVLTSTKTKKSKSFSNSKSDSGLDLGLLESILKRGILGNQELSKGIQFFLINELKEEKLKKLSGGKGGMDVDVRKKLDWSLKKSIEIVGLGSVGLMREEDEDED